MALRKRHGTAAKSGNAGKVIEVLPADELPVGVPALPAPIQRDAGGRVTTAEAARELGRRGGRTKAARSTQLGPFARALASEFREMAVDEGMKPYLVEAQRFYLSTCEHLSTLVGGGQCSAVIAAHVEAAATSRMFGRLYRAIATRQAFFWNVDKERTPKAVPRTEYASAAAQHFAAMRTALAAAHEYAAREAEARRERDPGPDPLAVSSSDSDDADPLAEGAPE